MLRLQTLGSFGLLDASGVNTPVPPHRLALLALLAAAGERGIARDKVLAYLWPESTPAKARASLEQMLHTLRASLEHPSALRGNPLHFDRDFATSDVADFRAALDTGDLERAVDLYHGPFLDGFYLSGVPEFEEWLENERAQLAERYAGALDRLAADATARGDHTRAVQHLRALGSVAPLSGRVACRLMEALAAADDRDGALEVAAHYAFRVREQLSVEPEPNVTALAEELRTQSAQPSPRVQPATAPLVPSTASELVRQPDAIPQPVEIIVTPLARTSRRRTLWAGLAAVLVAVMVGAWLLWRQQRADAVTLSPHRVAVFPFVVRAGPELQYLGEAVMDLLSQAVDGAGDLRRVFPGSITRRLRGSDSGPVDPALGRALASQLGAGRFMLGAASEVEDKLRISASLYDATDSDPIATSTRDGTQEALTQIVEAVARDLLARQTLGAGARLQDIRSVRAANFQALRDYLQAEALLRRGWFDSAGTKLMDAVRADSTFALAWYRLAYAQGWGAAGSSAASFARAMQYRGSLSARDRLLVEGRTAFSRGQAATAESIASTLTGRYPDYAEAWHLLGLTRGFYRWQQGMSHGVARAPLLRALALDPQYPEAIAHATMGAVHAGLYAQAESLLPRYPRGGGAGPVRKGLRAALAYATGGAALRDSTVREMALESDWVVFNIASQLSKGDSLRAAAWVWNYLADHGDRSPMARVSAQLHLGHIEMARGRRQAALAELAQAARVRPSLAFASLVWLSVIPFFQVPDAEVAALRDSAQYWQLLTTASSPDTTWQNVRIPDELGPWARDYFLGLVTARVGDSVSAVRHAAALERATEPVDAVGLRRDLALEIRALIASRAGRMSEALALLERTRLAVSSEFVALNPVYRRPIGRFLRAEALVALGRIDEALGWYDSFGTGAWGTEYVYGAPVHLRMGEIYERKGEPELAIAHYSRFVAKWRDADAQYQPLVREVEARLARLKRQRG